MGNSCSSGQAHKDRDNVSQHSEESPSYRAARPEDPAGPAEPPPDKKPPPKPRSVASVSDSVSLSSPVTSPPGREGAGSPAPAPAAPAAAAAALPEELRRLLLGAAPLARPPRRRALAVYVCAADSQDCCGEKGALQCGAAVRLRARARRAGWRVHVADLHWRSPLEQQRDHRLSALCTAELARQSELGALVPVVFLNAGLGTPLLPLTLDAGDFAAALAAAAHDQDRALLNKWYQLDAGATPACYRLARGAVRGRREMARALDVLVRTLPQEAADAYLTTVVEQEIQHTVLMSAEAARRCVWVTRGEGAPPPEPELARRLLALQRDLKQHLSERNIIRVSSRGAGAGAAAGAAGAVGAAGADAALGARLDAALDALLADDDAPRGWAGVPASLFEEIHEHLAFAQRAAQCTSNREITLNELKTYISGQSGVPLVLLGGAGCGKATLVARALPAAGRAAVVRFVGLTPASSSSHLLLKSIVDQLHVMVHGGVYRGRDSQAALSAALHRLLAASRRLLLCVVGADALRGARWLPSRLPAHVRCIVTVTEETDEPSSSAIMAVLSSEAGPRVLRAGAPGAAEAAAALAAAAAERPHRALPERVKAAAAACPLPLYAKILAWQNSVQEELFTDQSETEPPPEPAICATLDDQLLQVLVTAEAALGAARAAAALALLAAARRGLADEEVLDLLAHDPLFQSEETYLPWAPAALFWASLCALLGAWLRWDARGAARWRDAALAAAARDRYLAAGELRARRALADYWEGVWFEENDPKMAGRLVSQENKFSEDCYNSRKLDELPYQHYHLSRDQPELFALRPYFTDLRWIHDKVAANPCTWFLEDVALIQLEPLPEHVEILKDFLETHSYALDYDHRQFYGLLKQSLDRRIRSGLEIKSDICKRWLEAARNPPIPTLVPVNSDFLDAAEPGSEEAPGTRTFDLVVRLEGRFVATVSTEREEICVWDVTTSRRLRTLAGVPAPAALVPVGRRRAVVLCRRELRLYDLDKGQFLVALKGVMNQKMPYYGLHDARHLVALSRNRMYVNLMNIETGDCVTTFKAGEDRFLNSLLVSGDGRILVCGDETQKPFPLLVWSLTSRKLLYDLRIPHHDFDTSKAAITHEGSYVCVVSRELDEPSPNFIVVYDLQSGTLFKKWKPRADAHALAISSADGCVVSGHADARILVWDLVTGNCRLSLRGHVSAPTTLRLAAGGGALLSAAAPRLDRSVRLWDLRAGNLIAVYTPPERITCCEVLCGGSLVALAMENYKDLVTLRLDGPLPEVVTSEGADPEPYGTPENDGKVFDLTEADC